MFENIKSHQAHKIAVKDLYKTICPCSEGGNTLYQAITPNVNGSKSTCGNNTCNNTNTINASTFSQEAPANLPGKLKKVYKKIPNFQNPSVEYEKSIEKTVVTPPIRTVYQFIDRKCAYQEDKQNNKLIEENKISHKVIPVENVIEKIDPQNKEIDANNQIIAQGQSPIVIRFEQSDKDIRSLKLRAVEHKPDKNNSRPNAGVSADKLASRLDYRVMDNVVYVRMENMGGAFTIFCQHQLMVLLNMWFHSEAVACGTAKHLKEILDFLLIDPNHNVTIEESAGLRNRINFIDGYFDVNTGKYMPYDGKFYINYLNARAVDVERAGEPVNFDRFVWMIAGGNPLIYTKIWQMIAIIITNDFRLKKIFLCQGVGNAGKSTLLATIRLLYPDAQQADFVLTDFADPFTQTELFGKALNIGDENGKLVDAVAVEVLKKWSAGEHSKVSVRVKHQGARRVIPRTHLVFATNNAMTFEDATDAFFERLEVIPFGFRVNLDEFGVEDVVSDLFIREIPAIIKKAIGYYQQLRVNKFVFAGNFQLNAIVDKGAKRNLEDKMKIALKQFLDDNVELCQGAVLFLEDLRLAFNDWCMNIGANELQVTNQAKFRTYVEGNKKNCTFENKYNNRCGGHRSAIIGYVLKS